VAVPTDIHIPTVFNVNVSFFLKSVPVLKKSYGTLVTLFGAHSTCQIGSDEKTNSDYVITHAVNRIYIYIYICVCVCV
jgi:hypothetical protein